MNARKGHLLAAMLALFASLLVGNVAQAEGPPPPPPNPYTNPWGPYQFNVRHVYNQVVVTTRNAAADANAWMANNRFYPVRYARDIVAGTSTWVASQAPVRTWHSIQHATTYLNAPVFFGPPVGMVNMVRDPCVLSPGLCEYATN